MDQQILIKLWYDSLTVHQGDKTYELYHEDPPFGADILVELFTDIGYVVEVTEG